MTTSTARLRADLHVHSYHSGYASHLRFLRTRDCYSSPDDVYRVAKARGMDLVTITDHDSIGGCLEFLDRHPDAPDFFISEEIETGFPGVPMKLHVAAYDIDERIHAEAQRLRPDVFELTAYLRSEGVCFGLNHLFFFYQRQMPLDEYLRAAFALFPAFELRNGAMLSDQNELIEAIVAGRASGPTGAFGGSDAHTLRRIGRTYTEADGTSRASFLASLKAGRSRVGGVHGTTLDIAAEIYGVIGRYWRELLGFGRRDLTWPRRLLGLSWSAASLPVEFVPLLIAVIQKRIERHTVAACRRDLAGAPSASPAALDPAPIQLKQS
jgi:predicted metal-dependent phosphoesterase TrpH